MGLLVYLCGVYMGFKWDLYELMGSRWDLMIFTYLAKIRIYEKIRTI